MQAVVTSTYHLSDDLSTFEDPLVNNLASGTSACEVWNG